MDLSPLFKQRIVLALFLAPTIQTIILLLRLSIVYILKSCLNGTLERRLSISPNMECRLKRLRRSSPTTMRWTVKTSCTQPPNSAFSALANRPQGEFWLLPIL